MADVKAATGLLGALVAGAIAGGILPEIAKVLAGRMGRWDAARVRLVAFTAFVYAIVGVLVDLLYIVLAITVGPGRDWGTILAKMLIDQLIFTPFLGVAFAAYMFAWRGLGFRREALRGLFTKRGYLEHVWPMLPMCWLFWVPSLLIVYSLPVRLQFTFAILLEAAWSVLFVFRATASADESSLP
ncbi:MAG: hypothetical protein MH204_00825 [Fimbriimonadaceae bacterium]|nr:hypothetical protein [Fimbriimonadaceae bacterium]